MASARELLDQADALMRRNRARVVDTEIPELTEMVAMVALPEVATPAPAALAAPVVLDDVPELTEAVEEIEIESIVELPEDLDESSGWLHHDHGGLSVVGRGPDSMAANIATRTRNGPPQVAAVAAAIPELPAFLSAAREAPASPVANSRTAPADDWARWEALADEIRMQVLQRVDILTDTRLRDQLNAQLQPIVDRASAEMVSTINAQVGGLLRAYIAEAIEREIEKWRGPPG